MKYCVGDTRRSREIGYKGKTKWIWAACVGCGRERWVAYYKPSLRCRHCHPTGEHGPRWHGGWCKSKRGYLQVTLLPDSSFYSMANANGYILKHRLVMAEYLGRLLLPSETIHHLNGIKDDNRIENLELTTNKAHRRGYNNAYTQGMKDGLALRDKSLEKQIKMLQWQIKELSEALKLRMEL